MKFDIFGKNTLAHRYILKNSHHSSQHEMARFNITPNILLKILYIIQALRSREHMESPKYMTKSVVTAMKVILAMANEY